MYHLQDVTRFDSCFVLNTQVSGSIQGCCDSRQNKIGDLKESLEAATHGLWQHSCTTDSALENISNGIAEMVVQVSKFSEL